MAGLTVLLAAYVLSQFYRSFLAVLTPVLSAEIDASKADLAFASGIWFATFAAMQFIVGIGLDRFGPRRTASILFGLAATTGCAVFAYASAPWHIALAMGLIGIGCSPVLMASLFIFAKTFTPARFAFLSSAFVAIGSIGNIAGAAPLAASIDAFGWRSVIIFIGIISLVVAIAIFVVVKDPKSETTASGRSGLGGYLTLLKIPALWLIFPVMIVNYSAAAGIRGLWAGPFLADVHAADVAMIGQVTLWMAIAMAIGSFVYGPLDTIFNSRKWVVVTGHSLTVATLTFLAFQPASGLMIAALCLVIIGATGLGYGVIMAHSRAFFPSELTGRGVTLMNFFSIGGVALMQIITGRLIDSTFDAAAPAHSYQILFGFYALAIFLPTLLYAFSRDAKPNG